MLKAFAIRENSLWGKFASPEEIREMLMPSWTVVAVELDGNFYCFHPPIFLGNGNGKINRSTLKRRMDDAKTIFGFNANIMVIEGK